MVIARSLRVLALVGVFVLLTSPGFAEPSGPPPASAFAHLPMIANPQLSPDGKRIAFLYPVNGHMGLLIVDAKKTPESKVAGVKTDTDEILWYKWKTNNRLIVCLRNVDFPIPEKPVVAFHILAVDSDGSNQTDIWGANHEYGYNVPSLVDILLDDPEHMLVAYGSVFKVKTNMTASANVDRGWTALSGAEVVMRRFYDVGIWKENTKGEIRLGIGYSDSVISTYVLSDSGNWDLIHSFDRTKDPVFDPLGFSDDGKSLFVESSHENGLRALYEFDLATKSFKRKIFSVEGNDLDRESIMHDNKLMGIRYIDDREREYFIDPQYAPLKKGVDHALPNMDNLILHVVNGGKAALIMSQSPQEAGVYYVLTTGERTELTPLGSEYPELVPDKLATVSPITYKARDGQIIHGYLTVPHGMEGKPLPFIVLPHGGPTDRDEARFDWWVQFLATRGYGVLQPNFRGSSGYGDAFKYAGSKEWGRLMQDDVSDGAVWLKEQGLIKDNRVCIGGWSYGGYSAMAGAVFTPDLYRCAFSMAGVSSVWDLVSQRKYFLGYQDDNLPNVQTKQADAEAVSPINHVANIKIPILLMHADRDFTVPVDQSKDMERALRSAGKSVEAVYFEQDDHYLGKEKNRLIFLNTLEAFLAKNLGPGELTQ